VRNKLNDAIAMCLSVETGLRKKFTKSVCYSWAVLSKDVLGMLISCFLMRLEDTALIINLNSTRPKREILQIDAICSLCVLLFTKSRRVGPVNTTITMYRN
jgi:hypothetical protein